jgi:hypothetical protein
VSERKGRAQCAYLKSEPAILQLSTSLFLPPSPKKDRFLDHFLSLPWRHLLGRLANTGAFCQISTVKRRLFCLMKTWICIRREVSTQSTLAIPFRVTDLSFATNLATVGSQLFGSRMIETQGTLRWRFRPHRRIAQCR